MRLVRQLAELPAAARGGAVAIGNFDGVHRGHAAIVAELRRQAAALGGPAVIFTFDPHPVRLLRPDQAPPPLTWLERKQQLLAGLGVDYTVAYPTDEALLRLSATEFFDQIVRGALDARAIVEGPNFYFGHRRQGNIETLDEMCAAAAMTLQIVQPVVIDNAIVSSSRVRECLAAGDAAAACRLLTEPYRIRGMVTHGAGRGAKLGFPTANVSAIDTMLPAPGVYAGRAYVKGQAHGAAINLGPNPTFAEQSLKVEVHLLDFAADLYGEPLEVDFLARLRDIQRFSGPDEVREQIARDVQSARALIAAASC